MNHVARALASILLLGCATPPEPTEQVLTIGTSVLGRPIEALILGDGPEVVMVLASIHGSEPAGTPLVEALLAHLEVHPHLLEGRRLVVVPVVNPDGYAVRARHNDRGVDLNRNFPAANREERARSGTAGLSEPESRAIHGLLDWFPPARIVSIHQPLACVDYDGPARAIAAAMADRCDLPVRRLGSRPGSLGSYAGVDLGIPIITLELRRGDENLGADGLWAAYGAAMLAFVEHAPSGAAAESGQNR